MNETADGALDDIEFRLHELYNKSAMVSSKTMKEFDDVASIFKASITFEIL